MPPQRIPGTAEAELFSPFSALPGVYIQSSQIVESSGLYTLVSVLKAQLVTADKDALFYCELSYRLPSGNHMKESREVSVQVFCESQRGPGPRLVAAPASSPVRDGSGAEGRPLCFFAEGRPLCFFRPGGEGVAGGGARGSAEGRGPRGNQVSGGRQPPAPLHHQQAGAEGAVLGTWGPQEWLEAHSAHLSPLPQNLSTKEVEEMTPEDNGVLVLESAQKEHSGLYQCQGLDLETMASLLSDQQELLVNCEGPGARDGGTRRGQDGIRPLSTSIAGVPRCVCCASEPCSPGEPGGRQPCPQL